MKKIKFRFLTFLLALIICAGTTLAQGTAPAPAPTPASGASSGTGAGSGSGLIETGGAIASEFSGTIGVDLFEEDIDNVVFSTNEFLSNSEFTGVGGPFYYILQMSLALAALFSIILAANMGYRMMYKQEPLDVFKIFKVVAIALVLSIWYPGSNGRGTFLDVLAYIPNCIGSYTHDLYEAEAQQVQDQYTQLQQLVKERDTKIAPLLAEIKTGKEEIGKTPDVRIGSPQDGSKTNVEAQKADILTTYAATIINLDKLLMFLALIIYRIGWWSTIFCQQILLGMLTIFGPIQWAFSLLPKWEGAWAKWLTRYLTVHFYGAMLYFVGFYVLLLFDIVLSVEIENLKAITQGGGIQAYAHSAFLTCGYLLAASVIAMKCLNLVPDLAAWMIPEGDTAFSTRNFGEGVASSVKSGAMSVLPSIK